MLWDGGDTTRPSLRHTASDRRLKTYSSTGYGKAPAKLAAWCHSHEPDEVLKYEGLSTLAVEGFDVSMWKKRRTGGNGSKERW